jgi:hypothetical protein
MYLQFVSEDYKQCIATCSDRAKVMTEEKSGLTVTSKTHMLSAVWTHCFLHRHALIAKKMLTNLQNLLSHVVKIVNFINSRSLKKTFFPTVCEEIGVNHRSLLLRTEVQRLSRNTAPARLFEMRDEFLIRLKLQEQSLLRDFKNNASMQQLVYLADIFTHLNDMNISS